MNEETTIRLELTVPEEGGVMAPILMARRSTREYAEGQVTLSECARLLWAGQGVSHSSGKRTAPSPHALYPLSLFLAAARVPGIEPGLYQYNSQSHSLHALGYGDLRPLLYRNCIDDQTWVRDCAALIVIAGDAARAREAFAEQSPEGRRGLRYLHMEAGAAAQNIALQAVELGVGSVLVAGFDDDGIREQLGIAVSPLALLPLGRLPA